MLDCGHGPREIDDRCCEHRDEPDGKHQDGNARLATWQPWVYGGGQFLHIVGLVWSGGYGVQRKVAGAAQVLRTPQETAGMALMGIGGLVAVAGGVLFLVIVLAAIARRRGR